MAKLCGNGLHEMTEENTYTYKSTGFHRCKECNRIGKLRYYARHQERSKENMKKFRQTEAYRIYRDAYVKKRYAIDLPKNTVRTRTRYAISTGKLVKGVCQYCGNPEVDAHHNDYNNYLDVIWLCRLHHIQYHHKIINLEALEKEIIE